MPEFDFKIDYKAAAEKTFKAVKIAREKGKEPERVTLDVVISEEMNSLFVSPECTDDSNIIHDKNIMADEKHKPTVEMLKKTFGKRFQRELIPGMYLASIAEAFAFEFDKLDNPNQKRYARFFDIGLGLPSYPAENLSFSLDKGGHLMISIKGKLKRSPIAFSDELDKPFEFKPEKEPSLVRRLDKSSYSNFMRAIGYNPDNSNGHIPALFLASSNVSKALLEENKKSPKGIGFYRSISLSFYRPFAEFELGNEIFSYVSEKNGIFKVVSANSRNEAIFSATTNIEFLK